ncbi:MAG: hypothetical protein ACREE6_04535 [Limisphaerales bacterium]
MDKSRIAESQEPADRTKSPGAAQWIPFPIEFAALQNLRPAFLEEAAKLRTAILVVQFAAGKDSPIWGQPRIVDEIEAAIKSWQPSSFFPLGKQYHFFQVRITNIGAAARQIKEIIAARGLSEISRIFHVESAEALREILVPEADE